MILAFSVNDPLPDLPMFLGKRYLGLRTRYGDERRIILKHRTCTSTWHTQGNAIKIFSFFGERAFTLSFKFFPEIDNSVQNTLLR